MATGTPRPNLMPQKSSDVGKTWMSFDESPVHSGPTHQENSWTSFSDSTATSADTALHLPSSSTNYAGKPRLPGIPQLQVASPAARNVDNSSIVNRTGIGTEVHSSGGIHHQQHSVPAVKATHGPGSTMSHILRHKSGENEQETSSSDMPVVATNALVTKNQGDVRSNLGAHHQPSSEVAETPQISDKYYSSTKRGNESVAHDPWFVTEEQGIYYKNQFSTMQSKLDGKIDGQTARNFFTKSRLPIPELSHIWELCDMDQDGHLTLLEFCAAFHLVVARKNGYELPAVLPKSLLPPLMKMCGKTPFVNINLMGSSDAAEPDKIPLADQQKKDENPPTSAQIRTKNHTAEQKSSDASNPPRHNDQSQWHSHQEKWETFSDRTSSSTNLANFDQSLDHTDNLIHPVPLRITPSKHEAHSAKIRKDKPPPRSTDEDEHQLQKFNLPLSHKSLTNPYGSLKNDFSEPDSHTSPRARSSSNSSHSSTGTSDRSMSEIDTGFKPAKRRHASDQEYQSDWSSRPLQPRSASDSSIEGSAMERSVIAQDTQGGVPTPPPRPHQQIRASKSDSFESDNHGSIADVPDSVKIPTLSAPTPPPRPQQSNSKKAANQNEGFADFSQFEKVQIEESSVNHQVAKKTPPEESDSKVEQKQDAKPTPAPRYIRDERPAKEVVGSVPKEEKSPDKSAHRKAPTKPPRSRIQSVDSATQEHIKIVKSNSVTSPSDNIPSITEKPNQENSRSKVSIQQSIRDLKLQNSKLTKLNADLQQELKDVMQSRITVEMSIHQLRPFSQ